LVFVLLTGRDVNE